MASLLEEKDAILEVMARYCYAVDKAKDAALMAELFVEDGVWDGGAVGRFEGKAGIRDFMGAALAGGLSTRHFLSNHIVKVDGERATLHCYFNVYNGAEAPPSLMMSGFYENDLVKVGGDWMFTRIMAIM